ncbi:hypothetical protein NEOLEDRAFT_409269 [Neolentinus lepideus HHB14362 ss-1]|uniref:Small EDRK-rich factor-like N-terminal domain-containing protein n=1 Tax=Neolentinus lepideus HHB14362 ss-1 TaxID=1314782 RepID=A0A165S4R1_9AGAM|nr:hypothetical protein NEOLEDRAFT_409269 [Neolentinus lepideus HHB14362 ss-1]
MTRGDQRERDRVKAAKKAASSNKAKATDGMSIEKRKERDAQILRDKQKLKRPNKEAAGNDIAFCFCSEPRGLPSILASFGSRGLPPFLHLTRTRRFLRITFPVTYIHPLYSSLDFESQSVSQVPSDILRSLYG